MSHHILIIGAGASGLMAAATLIAKGHTVTVIEARDRTGGRIHTQEGLLTIPVESGAEFMHGKQPMTKTLLRKSKAKPIRLKGNHYQIWNGQIQESDFLDDAWSELNKRLRKLAEDTDMASFLSRYFAAKEYENLRQRVKGFVEGFDIADLNRVSALALRDEWAHTDQDQQYLIQGGYRSIIDYLSNVITDSGNEIDLSAPVTEIAWSATSDVKVKTGSGGQYEGEKVIVTVPLGVLQSGSIRFIPDVAAHRQAFREMGFGTVTKFHAEFDCPFWEDNAARPMAKTGFVFSDATIPTWWTRLPDPAPVLTGWLGGPQARQSHPEEKWIKKAVTSLAYIFQCPASRINRHTRQWIVSPWIHDPFAMGAYSYPTVKTCDAQSLAAKPVSNKIYFAGEHMYDGSSGATVEAALDNGKAVAKLVSRDLRKSR